MWKIPLRTNRPVTAALAKGLFKPPSKIPPLKKPKIENSSVVNDTPSHAYPGGFKRREKMEGVGGGGQGTSLYRASCNTTTASYRRVAHKDEKINPPAARPSPNSLRNLTQLQPSLPRSRASLAHTTAKRRPRSTGQGKEKLSEGRAALGLAARGGRPPFA